jgi:ATP-binding cassette subfamily B protein
VFEFLDLRPEVEEARGALELPVVRGDVEFREVSFSYDLPHKVLHHVSVAIPAGARIGIVGPTGAGKSTFVDLLLRFYDPQEGAILLDGHNLRELKFKTLRQNIAVITHDPYLFHTTIEENIRYASWQATDEEVRSAARVAEIHEFICSLPNGYATVVGEKGARLSAGQRQRIAIARAILRQASIWVFDEATATLDVLTESRIQESLRFWLRGRTLIVVSHRLSSMRHVDQILVVDAGEVVQLGTHVELLEANGLYRQLYLTANARKQETVLSPG